MVAMSSAPQSRLAAIVMLLVSMVSIQSGASFAKHLFPLIGTQGMAGLRLVFASFILCAIWRPWRIKLTRSEKASILLYGLSLGAMNLLFYMALARIPLGITVALEFAGPLSVALFLSRRPLDFLWVCLAVAGLLLLSPLGDVRGLDPLGILYALGAAACWALYIVFGKKAVSSAHGGKIVAIGMTIAACFIAPIGVISAGASLLNPAILLPVLSVAILSSALPYSLEMAALKNLPTKTFGILMSLEPAAAALSGLVFLNEELSLTQWAAIACVMAASAGSAAFAHPGQVTPETMG